MLSIRDAMHKAERVGMDCYMTLVMPNGHEKRVLCHDPYFGIWRLGSGVVFADALEEIGVQVKPDSISMTE